MNGIADLMLAVSAAGGVDGAMAGTVLWVPPSEYEHAAFGNGVCGARPPVASLQPRNGRPRWVGGNRGAFSDARGLVLAWNNRLVPEGVSRGLRVLSARVTGKDTPALWVRESTLSFGWRLVNGADNAVFMRSFVATERGLGCHAVPGFDRLREGDSVLDARSLALSLAHEVGGSVVELDPVVAEAP